MSRISYFLRRAPLAAVMLAGAAISPALAAPASPNDNDGRHVLLISVDGLHEFDLQQWITTNPGSNLAMLSRMGTTYQNAYTPMGSDSFPGLLAQVTGGTQKTTGVFYDDSYSRDLWAPGSSCVGAPGSEVVLAENLDVLPYPTPPAPAVIDPSQLPLALIGGKCQPLYPHSFLQTNTIFEVAHHAGLYTAWSDKHPAYDILNGASGNAIADLYTPEINNNNDPTKISAAATAAYDQTKVQAILNEIDGKKSDGSPTTPAGMVPAIFGMNFQAVSVGQKLVDPALSCAVPSPLPTCDKNYVPGGYEPGTLAFTPQMRLAMSYVDTAIGSMVSELQARNLWASTKLIISAKHGQSPIDPARLQKIGDPISTILQNAGVVIGQNTEDDISLVWLKDQSQANLAVKALQASIQRGNPAQIQHIYAGNELAAIWGDPAHNSRTPDLIIQPIPGVIYTTSKAKVAEHGGFSEDDRHVALLVVGSSPEPSDAQEAGQRTAADDAHGRVVFNRVYTMQIAPTILQVLDLDPALLHSVVVEGTRPLPR